jgi:Oligosaccaryltransferase
MIGDRELGAFTVCHFKFGHVIWASVRLLSPQPPLQQQLMAGLLPLRTRPQSWLGILIMFLLVVYHYVTADPSFVAAQQQQQRQA